MSTVKITRSTLADGREIIFFDDSEPYLSGKATRNIQDTRLLEARTLPPHEAACIRVDPLTGDSVTIAAHRNNRTFLPPADEDPLAPSGVGSVPGEIPEPTYDVVVFENRFPSLQGPLENLRDEPLFKETTPGGRCEVVSFTSDQYGSFGTLSYERARTVVEAWAHRTRELSAREGIAQVFPFENRGEEIGVTLPHPHGQIYAYPYLPPYTAQLVRRANAWATETGGDLLGDVLAAELVEGNRVIAETEHFVAYVPYAAKWPVEFMVVPRRAARDFTELTEGEKDELTALYLDLLSRLDYFFEGISQLPYIAAWHQAPLIEGENVSRMYLHVFSLMRSPGKMKYLAGSESAMAAWISDTTPERIAARLRELAQPTIEEK
ncbi:MULTISPECIES: galactose-1-phosphate uridylyltransferase [Rothia]|uniref:Galactose-1-phosphate uridylyltransferase n=1 Tax=Rothia nasimurium TaxID=85336 RepID=A0A1Y1RN45_9MICC|nr:MULTISPECIES: galactose-1-phosphate uridylyltransferase [Rothia]ORC16003.1 galactose-1-phosphate uridylyltransferase [Rothia nasimurium]